MTVDRERLFKIFEHPGGRETLAVSQRDTPTSLRAVDSHSGPRAILTTTGAGTSRTRRSRRTGLAPPPCR